MFFYELIIINFIRNKCRTFIMIMLFFFLVFFCGIYIGNLEKNQTALDELGERIPVTAAIANIGGDRVTGLEITESKLQTFLELDLYDTVITSESYCNIGRDKEHDEERISAYMFATNTDILLNSMGVEFEQKQDEINAILSQKKSTCYLNRNFMKERMLFYEIGDEIDINIFQAKYDELNTVIGFEEVANGKLVVDGFFDMQSTDAAEVPVDIICPVGWLAEQYRGAGLKMYYTSATGMVSNPLKLNALKEQARALKFPQINPQRPGERFGTALVIDDRLYIETASQLKRNIQLLIFFSIPLFLLIIILNMIIAYFIVINNRKFILLQRCLGMKRRVIVEITLCDSSVALIIGGVLAISVLHGLQLISVYIGGLTLELCFLTNILGSVYPILKMCTIKPIKLYSYVNK